MGRVERRSKKTQQPANYLQQEKRWRAHIRDMVPKIYAGFCLALYRKLHLNFEEIVDILMHVQHLWMADGVNGFDIVKVCAEETGINVISKVAADAAGIDTSEGEVI